MANRFVVFGGLTSAGLRRSGRKKSRAAARISPAATSRRHRFTSRGWKILPQPGSCSPSQFIWLSVLSGKTLADKRVSNRCKCGYLCPMKPASQLVPVEMEKLKPVLHDKIERMDGQHLALVNRLLLQLEAEELAERLGEAFNKDHEQGLLRRIPELVKQFRAGHRYA